MMNLRTIAWLLTLCAAADGQIPSPFELSEDQLTAAEQALAYRHAADFEAWRLIESFNAFAIAWNAFLEEYSAHGVFNVKKARAAVRAWRKIELSLPR